jgi:hypothetical protein
MADSQFFDLITSKEWRDGLALLLVKGERLKGEGGLNRDWIEHRYGSIDAALGEYIKRGEPLPVWLSKIILEERKRKKGGRHTRAKQRARQQANDCACLLAVKDLMLNQGLLQTPAEARVGKAMNLTRPAVHGACIREENLLRLLGLHPEEPSCKKQENPT